MLVALHEEKLAEVKPINDNTLAKAANAIRIMHEEVFVADFENQTFLMGKFVDHLKFL